ncbi:MAG: hypothetical protein M3R17_04255 [Bacteroidota bacterium]|nr:hypothetical protein [Bacteroidota bacterium]
MTQKELKRIFSKGECLSLDMLRLYNEGKLAKKSMHEVEMHLLECNLCSGAVDGLNTKRIAEVNKLSEHIQRRLAVYMNTPPRVPFFQRFGLVLISGVILLSVGGTCLYFARNKDEKPVISDTSSTTNKKDLSISAPNGDNNALLVSTPSATLEMPANSTANATVNDEHTILFTPPNDKSAGTISGQTNPSSSAKQEATTSTTNATTAETIHGGATTRSENSPLRVKLVQIYPAVTHNDKQTRKEAKDGQLGKPSSGSSSFALDEMPSFPGGNDALRNYIISNFKPTAADRSKLTKYATGVRFIVNAKTGAVSAPEISVSISPEIDKELLRVINSLPDYTPGKKRGEVEVVIGITFE